MTTHLAYTNVNYGFGTASHTEQIQDIIDKGAKIICYSEMSHHINFEGYRNLQPFINGQYADEGMYVSKDFEMKPWNFVDCTDNNFGQKIGNRQFVIMRGHFPQVGNLKIITGHMPHPRMGEEIYSAYSNTLHRIIARSRVPVMVCMDFNKRVEDDPCHLNKDYDMKWKGKRIDLWSVAKSIHVPSWWEDLDPTRKDRHPVVHLVV